jgi:hypothetical protein
MGQPVARPKQADRNNARPNRTGHRVDRRSQVPNCIGTPAYDWRNYPLWSGDWWSAKWGGWFCFDPETSAYYCYEPAIGAYAEIQTITTYRQPAENSIPEPTTNPDEISDDDDPPPPEEP